MTGAGAGAAGAGRGSFGNGKGTGDDYLERVRSWVMKYRKRPPDGMKQERSTVLLIALARDGTVLDAQIVASSGVQVLDQLALDIVHRASPVPPVPPNIPGEPLRFRMPFDFRPSLWERLF
jgi:protein TonB